MHKVEKKLYKRTLSREQNIKYKVKHTIKVCTLISEDDPHLLVILKCM